MKINHALIFCFLSALCAGNSRTAFAINTYMGPGGGNGSISCYFTKSASTKFFCKNDCEADDLLIKMDGVSAQSGRYSIKYQNGSSGKGIVSVTITHLIKSDAGRYRCGLGGSLVPDSYSEFGIIVSDELLDKSSGFTRTVTEGENTTRGCSNNVSEKRKFLCKNKCNSREDILIDTNDATAQRGRYSLKYDAGSALGLYVTINQLTQSDTGWYRCGYGNPSSPDSYDNFQIIVTADQSTSTPQTTTKPRWTSRSSSYSLASFTTSDQLTAFSNSHVPGSNCLLSWGISGSIVAMLLLAVVLLLLYIWRLRRNSGFYSRENALDKSKDVELSGKCEDSVYENFDQASRSQYQSHTAYGKA